MPSRLRNGACGFSRTCSSVRKAISTRLWRLSPKFTRHGVDLPPKFSTKRVKDWVNLVGNFDALTKQQTVYDNDCDICRYWIVQWQHATGNRISYVPYQEVAASNRLTYPRCATISIACSCASTEPHVVTTISVLMSLQGWLILRISKTPKQVSSSSAIHRTFLRSDNKR